MSHKGEKQYGLILPKKPQPVTPSISNIFGDDGGSDEDDGTDWVRKALKAEGEKIKIKKQTKLDMQRALNENPTIYQYDEVYDDMERTKTQLKATKQEDKKPKYIQSLLKAAERRKKEQEHRIERMVQKEREAEGDAFADKESFVTSAYRAKLEEFKKMEEEEARMTRLESIGDVTKQQDLSGFYRHLYEQTVDAPKEDKDEYNKNKEDCNEKIKISEEKEQTCQDKSINEISITAKTRKSRQYRQRIVEDNSDDSEAELKLKLQDESKSSASPQHQNEDNANQDQPQMKKLKMEHVQSDEIDEDGKAMAKSASLQTSQETKQKKGDINQPTGTDKEQKDSVNAKERLELAKKERSQIWEKRTVGPAFQAALERYYVRKAMRLSAA